MKHKLNLLILLLFPLFLSSCEKLARNKIIGLWTTTDYVLTSDDGTTMPKTPETDEVFDKWRKGSTIEFFGDGVAYPGHMVYMDWILTR